MYSLHMHMFMHMQTSQSSDGMRDRNHIAQF